jgi:hypothetical protein
MNKKLIFQILIYAILFSSCTSRENNLNPILNFPKTVNLSSKHLKSADSIFRAETMILIHDYLIVHDIDLEYVYKIINVEQDRYLKRFGKLGEAPNELMLPVFINRVGTEGNRVGINEASNQTFHEYSIDSIINSIDDSDRLLTTEKFDYGHIRVANIDSNLFVGFGFYENPYTLISGTKTIENTGNFPFREQLKNFSSQTLVMAYQPRFFKNPKKPLLLSSATFSFNLDFLKVGENGKLEIYKSLHFWPTDFEDESFGNEAIAAIKKENRFGNISTTVSENYIYVLYSDKPWEFVLPQKSNRILVYDWEGNSIRILKLDQEVNLIAAHEDDNYLIGYLDDGKANLFRFDLE